jgi:hypothetical protein
MGGRSPIVLLQALYFPEIKEGSMIGTGYRDNWRHGKHGQQHAPYFGTSVGKTVGKKIAKEAGQDILNLGVAQKLYKIFGKGPWTQDPRIGGLSMEDVAARLLNLMAITVPQGVVAIWTNTSAWERNAQNVLSLAAGVGLSMLFKHDKLSFNSLLDPFMKPLPKDAGKLRRLLKPLHAKVNYFDILKAAGVEFKPQDCQKAFWARMDGNQRALVDALHHKLKNKKMQGLLTDKTEKAILEALPRFRAQLIGLPFLSTTLIMLSTIYVLGYATTKFVFKVFVPWDEKREKQAAAAEKKGAQQPVFMAQQKPVTTVHTQGYPQTFAPTFQKFQGIQASYPSGSNQLIIGREAVHVAH